MSNIISKIEEAQFRSDIPDFKSGDTIRVFVRIIEGEKERIQVYEGVVIAMRNAGIRSSITVRKVSYNVGVERIFPIHSPIIQKMRHLRKVLSRTSVRNYQRSGQRTTSKPCS